MSEVERWKPIPGYEDAYEISDHGNCRRSVNRFGNPSGRPLRPSLGRGYHRFTLSLDDHVRIHTAHKLVWIAFCGSIPSGMQINHKNGIKSDNRLANLEVVTPSENTQHAHKVLGYTPKRPPHVPGSKNGRALVTESDVHKIRERFRDGETQMSIAASFGITQTTVSRIVLRQTWKSVA